MTKSKTPNKPKIIRALRHWKQQFDKNAVFICRRSFKWDDTVTEVGEEIPAGLFANKGKLRNMWNANWIELGEFEEPEDVKAKAKAKAAAAEKDDEQIIPDGVTVEAGKGAWVTITLPNGDTVKKNGKKQIAEFFANYTLPEPVTETVTETETEQAPDETVSETEENSETDDETDGEPEQAPE